MGRMQVERTGGSGVSVGDDCIPITELKAIGEVLEGGAVGFLIARVFEVGGLEAFGFEV